MTANEGFAVVKWMMDTDMCTAIIKKHPIAGKKLRGKSIGQVGVSSITLGEFAFGAEKSSRPKRRTRRVG